MHFCDGFNAMNFIAASLPTLLFRLSILQSLQFFAANARFGPQKSPQLPSAA